MKKDSYSDEEIIIGLRKGTDKVLNYLYKNYYGAVRNLVFKTNGTEEQARDLFQEVLIVVYNKLQDDNFKLTSSFFTFFYAVIKYSWLDFRKTSKRNPLENAIDFNKGEENETFGSEIEDLGLKAGKNSLFRAYFNQLPNNCQFILRLALADYSAEEIAVELNYASSNIVRKQKSICLAALIEKIRKDPIFKELI